MLPISQHLADIEQRLNRSNTLILQAEPGAGKSTQVPLHLINASFLNGKKIILLEPRRVAAKAIAYFLAEQLNEKVGEQVGYHIRNEHKVSRNTRLEIMTEGVLTRKLQNDPELSDVGLIIFDEFHERSLHADLALLLAKEVQQGYRDDLKLLVMSATLDSESLGMYLSCHEIMHCHGRSYPVDVSYLPRATADLHNSVITAVNRLLANESAGDILVFLPGQGDINKCLAKFNQAVNSSVDYLPLYGALPLKKQQQVLKRNQSTKRRVILSTNIAETSLTIEGIGAVVDSGLEKTMIFDVKSGLSKLVTASISKASATQRAGRAGRLQAGVCVRLWPESKQASMAAFLAEEITTSDLSQLVLELSAWGICQYHEIDWLTPPPEHHFNVALALNQSLGLMDNANRLTKQGQLAQTIPVEPRIATMLINAQSVEQKQLSCLLAALLSERDLLSQRRDVDLVERLLVFKEALENKLSANHNVTINRVVLEQVTKLAKSFANTLNVVLNTKNITLAFIQNNIGELLLKAFPDRLAQLRSSSDCRYQLTNGRGITLRETDPLCSEPWLVVCDCDGQNKDGLIYSAVALTKSQVKHALSSHLVEQTHYGLDANKEKVTGRKQLSYGQLVIEEQILSSPSAAEFHACLKDIIQQQGLSFLAWSASCQSWLQRVKWLAEYEPEFAEITEARLLANIETWLLPYLKKVSSIKQLKQQPIHALLTANLTWQQSQLLDKYAPTQYIAPSGKKATIVYDNNQGPKVAIVLQEVFGELASPLLANGKVPLRFELLSPAKRPVQITSDLANFWQTSYFAVAKDMKAQYPKHRWPEKPLEEKAGRSFKPRPRKS